MRPVHEIEYDGCTPEEWKQVLDAMHSGKQVKIHDSIYWYFLGVLPPRRMNGCWFIFAEGADDPIVFRGSTPESRTAQRFSSYEKALSAVGLEAEKPELLRVMG